MAESRIPAGYPVIVDESSDYFTENSTLTYTGYSFTIPAKSMFSFYVFLGYQNHAPSDILLSKASDSNAPYYALAHGNGAANAFISGYTPTALTVYVWAAYGAGGSNSKVYRRGWYKTV